MRCKSCDYRLWNLLARRCPECGTPFLPSAYEFAPHTVQFCCPHCDQPYYGMGPKGHLAPSAFDCVSCGRHVHMDEMVLRPTAGLEEEQTLVPRVPWLERKQRGWIKAWLATVGLGLVAPQRLMRIAPRASSSTPAWGFAVLTTCLVTVATLIPFTVVPLVLAVGLRSASVSLATSGAMAVVAVIAAIVLLAFVALWGCTTHGLLRLLARPAGGIGRTYQAICFSSGANVATALPCLGVYVGWIWWLISAVLMVKEGQEVRGGRAALAVLPLPLLAVAGLIALLTWGVFASLSGAGAFAAARAQRRAAETQTVLSAVLDYAEINGGRGPDHAAQLVAAGCLPARALIGFYSMTLPERVPVGDVTLDQLDSLTSEDARDAAEAAADALPAGTTAHRLGDFVFTYHGFDIDTADPRLWVVIRVLDPAANGPPFGPEPVVVGYADDSVAEIPPEKVAARLAEQNALRATYDLPPLPDPTTVMHAGP
jgi:hypothetical protein